MIASAEVSIQLLDTRFRITADDDRMLGLVRELWSPFVVPSGEGAALRLDVERWQDGWALTGEGITGGRATDPWVLAAVLRSAVSGRAIADASGIVPLHGAAAEKDGRFMVLSGPPKAGKTTLLLELLDRGWRLVTDDLVPFDAGELTAMPFPKPLSVREPALWRKHAARWTVPGWLPEPSSVGLIPPTAFPLAPRRPFRVTLVVFSRFDPGAAPVTRRLTPGETVAACAQNLHPAVAPGPGALAAFARLGGTVAGASVTYGSTEDALKLLGNGLAGPATME